MAHRVGGVDTGNSEGGLLGLAVSPTYAKDKLVYAYYTRSGGARTGSSASSSAAGPDRATGLAGRADPQRRPDRLRPRRQALRHVGDAGDTSNAQDRGSQNGKILRMNPDGSVPADNPFSGSRVWSLGHRNPQGIDWDSKRLWAAEFGQNTFDEVNLIQKGKNYGWPDVEGRGDTQGGKFVNPKSRGAPRTSSPSGLAISKGRCSWPRWAARGCGARG